MPAGNAVGTQLVVSLVAIVIGVIALAISAFTLVSEDATNLSETTFSSSHIRVDILFPTLRDDGSSVEEEEIYEVQRDLTLRFGGATRYPPFNGSSMNPDGTVHDGVNNSGFFVIAQNTQTNLDFFDSYREKLQNRLDTRVFMTISPSVIVS